MKKVLMSMITASVLGVASLSANPVGYDDEFARMNQIFQNMMQDHFSYAKIANFGYPRVDIQNKKDAYIYEFSLAGVPKENIKLTINDDNILTIEGKKESKTKEEQKGYVRQEMFYGSFEKMVQLPEDADHAKLEAKYKDGVLTLSIPKKEIIKPKAKVITIN